MISYVKLIMSRMKGTVFWSCVSCQVSGNQKLDIKLVPYDPGSSFTILWCYILPAKRRVNIYTICQFCLATIRCCSFEEEMEVVFKIKNLQLFLQRRAAWAKQEWKFWVHNLEFQEIQRAVIENEEIFLHLSGSAALSLAKH